MPNRASRPPAETETGPPRSPQLRRLIEAAVALADRDGLDAVSIRRLARELGTRPMTIYTYVRSKDELLELMADRVVAEVVLEGPLPAGWRSALAAVARRSHEVFLAHPWLLAISQRRPDLGPGALRHAEQLLAAIAPLGLAPADAWQVLFVVGDYALGHALRVVHAPAGRVPRYPDFDPAHFPHLEVALAEPPPNRGRDTFEAGLELLLDAIEQRYARRLGNQPHAPG